MEDGPVNSSQEVIHRLCFVEDLVPPKRIARRLHMHANYLSDVCRRDRVDFLAICNEILKDAEPLAETDLTRYSAICLPILRLVIEGTSWGMTFVPKGLPEDTTYVKLCEQVGVLCEDLGGTITALAQIESDGVVDENDDPTIAECQHKIGLLVHRLQVLSQELHRRRAARVQP